jgi:hypothetical protein
LYSGDNIYIYIYFSVIIIIYIYGRHYYTYIRVLAYLCTYTPWLRRYSLPNGSGTSFYCLAATARSSSSAGIVLGSSHPPTRAFLRDGDTDLICVRLFNVLVYIYIYICVCVCVCVCVRARANRYMHTYIYRCIIICAVVVTRD